MERPAIRDVLVACGFATLTNDPDSIEAALGHLAIAADEADDIRRASLRNAAVNELKELGVTAPARLVDSALSRRKRPRPLKPVEDEQVPEGSDLDKLFEAARPVLEADDQLSLFRRDLVRLRYAGGTAAAELLHVALNSRAHPRPIGVALHGPSASGKTHTLLTVLRFHPANAMHDVSAMSERYLAYARFETKHRYVAIGEASALHNDGVGATLIRELSWGAQLRYGTVVKGDEGPESVMIEKPGPTGLITTTCRDLDAEIATRLLEVQITDDPAQTRSVVDAIATSAAGAVAAPVDFDVWHAASDWLAFGGERRVVIPFARAIAAGVPTESVRMRRDFEQIITVVRVLAFMHQLRRERDELGRIVASIADYQTAYRLLLKTLSVTLDRVSDELRETVAVVQQLNVGRDPLGASYPELAAELGLSRSGAWRRVESALREGYLVNTEERRGHPARIVVGDPLPADRAVLPDPSEVALASGAPESTQRVNTSVDNPTAEGETGVERGVERNRALTQRDDPLNTPRNTDNANDDAGSGLGVDPLTGSRREDYPKWLRRGIEILDLEEIIDA